MALPLNGHEELEWHLAQGFQGPVLLLPLLERKAVEEAVMGAGVGGGAGGIDSAGTGGTGGAGGTGGGGGAGTEALAASPVPR